MPLFSRVFKNKDANRKLSSTNNQANTNSKPQWEDSWLRTRVDPEEVAELIHGCTEELKSRALDVPFLLLPFRPSSDPSAAKSFIRNYFLPSNDRPKLKGTALINELRMTEAMVLISVMKWCWARLPGGVVSWNTYKMFRVGEKDSKYARNAFSTFIPISVDSKARIAIINDFFDLLAALAAHGKTNGLSGYKLSRYAGWWAFEHYDTGKGFEAGYKAWHTAADATCHLFFAYLRSSSPDPGKTNGVLDLPRSLQHLIASTEYPPTSSLISNDTTKVVMIVDVVSPTPYALLRRAKNFEYRDDDRGLQQFSDYDDPIESLTDECRRVLRAISTTNQSQVSDAKTSTSLVDPSWSRFEDIGFSTGLDDIGEDDGSGLFPPITVKNGLSASSRSPVMDLNRPTTPSWADFLSSGFTDENGNRVNNPILLPPDKMLPPINTETRGQSSQSHRRGLDTNSNLEPGELASITKMDIDDSFWWVWISSLAGEEPTSRKACFGRCALIETSIIHGRWMVMEEQVKGAAPEPIQGAYIAEKKSFLGFTTKRGKLSRRRSGAKKNPLSPDGFNKTDLDSISSTTLAPDQQAKIRKAAMALATKKKAEEAVTNGHNRRGRFDDNDSRNNSIFTLGPHIKEEVSPALQWARQYDKDAIRAQYLGNQFTGKGSHDLLALPANGLGTTSSNSTLYESTREKDLPVVPQIDTRPRASPVIPSIVRSPTPVEAEVQPQLELAPTPISKMTPPRPAAALAPAEPVQPLIYHAATLPSEQSAGHYDDPLPPIPSATEKIEALPEVTKQPDAIHLSTNSNRDRSSSPEQPRKGSLVREPSTSQRPNGIKKLFGNMRKGKEEPPAPPPAPIANPSVAAARRALESKINPPRSEPVQNNFVKYKGVRTPIAPVVSPVTEPEPSSVVAPVAEQDPVPVVQHQQHVSILLQQPAPSAQPRSEQSALGMESKVNAGPTIPAPAPKTLEPALPLNEADYQPPRIRRDAEFDQLSRIDTGEREQADKEFSKFDQGPLLDQPATLPDGYLHNGHDIDEQDDRAKYQSIYSAVTMDAEDTSEDEEEAVQEPETKLSLEVSANDRWAQIRRNAAERAARFSEDHGTRSRTETRTDDGETSGEETIESRVARIKARVAELTGNMEGVRR